MEDLNVATECVWALLMTRGEDDDTAPSKVGAALLAEAAVRLIRTKQL